MVSRYATILSGKNSRPACELRRYHCYRVHNRYSLRFVETKIRN